LAASETLTASSSWVIGGGAVEKRRAEEVEEEDGAKRDWVIGARKLKDFAICVMARRSSRGDIVAIMVMLKLGICIVTQLTHKNESKRFDEGRDVYLSLRNSPHCAAPEHRILDERPH